jgi:intracellular sulfur oxidation DsrE/DsrF family protein
MRKLLGFLFLAACVLAGGSAFAQGQPAGFWVTPAIDGFGRIHPLPQGAYQPNPAETYKIVFSVTAAAKTPSDVSFALDRVARTVNLYVSAGVPLSHLKFVAVVSGPATAIALDDAHYKAAFGVANPNLLLISELRKAGVDVAVCAQAVAEHEYDYAWLDPSVTLALSALTTISTLEQQGYLLLPL